MTVSNLMAGCPSDYGGKPCKASLLRFVNFSHSISIRQQELGGSRSRISISLQTNTVPDLAHHPRTPKNRSAPRPQLLTRPDASSQIAVTYVTACCKASSPEGGSLCRQIDDNMTCLLLEDLEHQLLPNSDAVNQARRLLTCLAHIPGIVLRQLRANAQ